jgi:cytochrome P450
VIKSLDQYDFLDPQLLAEPFDFYRLARSREPVFKVERPLGRPDVYLVTTYTLIKEVSQNAELFSSSFMHLHFERIGGNPEADAILERGMRPGAQLLLSNDPQHKRYRGMVNSVFTGVRVNKWTPAIERITDELIDTFVERGSCDFVNEFAVRLPTYVIGDILGVERSTYEQITIWSDAIIRLVSRMLSHDEEVGAARLMVELDDFLLDLIRKRRAEPRDDLVSALVETPIEGAPPLTDEAFVPLVREITVAGNETTRNTLISGLLRLLRNPEQMRSLLQDSMLVANAVEEILRIETPATAMWRVATRETQLGGVTIPKGGAILLRYDSGNRDETQFSDPDVFNIRRPNASSHVSFGAPGIHRCLGQMLARKELGVAFPRLLIRLKNLRTLDQESDGLRYWAGLLHRGIGKLHLQFEPGEKLATRCAGADRVALRP